MLKESEFISPYTCTPHQSVQGLHYKPFWSTHTHTWKRVKDRGTALSPYEGGPWGLSCACVGSPDKNTDVWFKSGFRSLPNAVTLYAASCCLCSGGSGRYLSVCSKLSVTRETLPL